MERDSLKQKMVFKKDRVAWTSFDKKVSFVKTDDTWEWGFWETHDYTIAQNAVFQHSNFSTRKTLIDYIKNVVYPSIGQTIQMEPICLFSENQWYLAEEEVHFSRLPREGWIVKGPKGYLNRVSFQWESVLTLSISHYLFNTLNQSLDAYLENLKS